jgi:predicted GIY-YIG superfamily endonuclease
VGALVVKTTTVYLLHFDELLSDHAGHYVGSTSNLDARLEEHRSGNGARIMEVCKERGIGFQLARTWKGGRKLERLIKSGRRARLLCPICSGDDAYKRGNRRAKVERKPRGRKTPSVTLADHRDDFDDIPF